MANAPLMPKATAVWLVDNTSLSFAQIAEFCHLHELEVKAIADGDAAQGIRGIDPISNGQLTRDEVEKGEANSGYRLKLIESKVKLPEVKRRAGPRYTPVSRRHDRPNAILWLIRNHPELKDAQIMRLVGTTKTTIQSIRDRTHWNTSSLSPLDPVTLGLCSQLDLDLEVTKAARNAPPRPESVEEGQSLLPTEVTTGEENEPFADFGRRDARPQEDAIDVDSVFAKLKNRPRDDDEDDEEER
jgi:uncharacterized protein